MAYMPKLLAGLIVAAVGIVVAWIAARLIIRLLVFLRLDRIAGRLGTPKTFARGDVRHAFFSAVGGAVWGVIFLIFLDKAIQIWDLALLSRFLERVLLFIPNLLLALVILLVGWGVASAVARNVRRALYQEDLPRATLVARISRACVLIFATACALIQIGLAVKLVVIAFSMIFGALALSFVIAFGLGSRRAVEALWEERRNARVSSKTENASQTGDGKQTGA